jgi:DNA polymerase I-like protein with 3'-5' exonuclease and polymerase domains
LGSKIITDWEPPKLSSLPSWENCKKIAFDIETCDPDLTKGKGSKNLGANARRDNNFMVGYSFAFDDGPAFYLPFAHEAGGNLNACEVMDYLEDQSKIFKGEMVGMNLGYDLDFLAEAGIWFKEVSFFRDIGNADPLICELHDKYNMNAIAKRHGCKGKDESLLEDIARQKGLDPKRDLWKLHSRFVGAYGEQDARLPLEILKKQQVLLEQAQLSEVFDLESELLPVLVKMKHRGVLIDQDQLARVEDYAKEEELKAYKLLAEKTPFKLELDDCNKAAKLDPVFKSIGITLPRTPTGLPSVKKDDVLNYNHPIADAISWARRVNKLRTTFVSSVKRHMTKGRLHCTFNQIAREVVPGEQKGARYGRLSCSNPNLQQQPSRDEFADMWRKIYIPEPGMIWSCNDFSQQEPRWVAHFAARSGLEGAEEMVKEYNTNPKADNHKMMAQLTGLERDPAKALFLGFTYGEGGVKFCLKMGYPLKYRVVLGRGSQQIVTDFENEHEAKDYIGQNRKHTHRYMRVIPGDQGQSIIDRFNEKVPFVRELSKKVQARAARDGFIRTILKRRLNFPEKENLSGYDFVYRALNRLIQGSSGDQMKKALIALDREIPEYFLQLTVHDETDGSVESPEVSKKVAQVMADVIPSLVKFRVKVEVGPSWGEKQLIEEES